MRIARTVTALAVTALLLTGCTTPDADVSPPSSSTTSTDRAHQQTGAGPSLADTPRANTPDAQSVIPALPTDPTPQTGVGASRVRLTGTVHVYATSSPIDLVPVAVVEPWDVEWAQAGDTAFPVFEREGDRALIPLMSRTGLASAGATGQAVGWVDTRRGVELYEDDREVMVSLEDQTITVTDGDTVVTESVGVGAPGTRTPTGRTAIVNTWSNLSAVYTEGRPIVALARFSDEADDFGPMRDPSASSPPLLAAHYYWGEQAGEVSNGCLRVSDRMTELLAGLPAGTPVVIR